MGTGALSPGVKQPGCEADYSFPSNAEVGDGSYTSTPPYVFIAPRGELHLYYLDYLSILTGRHVRSVRVRNYKCPIRDRFLCTVKMKLISETMKGKKGKDIPVTGRGGPQGCKRLWLPHYLDKRLTDGGKVVSPTRRTHFAPRFLFLRFLVLISVRG
jgi:hypothetical protein